MRILVSSAAPRLAEGIRILLVDAGAICDVVDTAQDLEFGLDYDCLVLDLDDFGLEALRRVRNARPTLQIVTLSRKVRADEALGAGADDFLDKPFRGGELVARIRARIRRVHGHSTRTVEIGPLKVDINERVAYLDGTRLHLTKHEYGVVEILVMRRGRVITKEQILAQLYQVDDEPTIKIIDVYICKIRKKLGAAAWLIETVWGRGYIIRESQPQALAEAA